MLSLFLTNLKALTKAYSHQTTRHEVYYKDRSRCCCRRLNSENKRNRITWRKGGREAGLGSDLVALCGLRAETIVDDMPDAVGTTGGCAEATVKHTTVNHYLKFGTLSKKLLHSH